MWHIGLATAQVRVCVIGWKMELATAQAELVSLNAHPYRSPRGRLQTHSAAPFVFHGLCLQAELVSIGIKNKKMSFDIFLLRLFGWKMGLATAQAELVPLNAHPYRSPRGHFQTHSAGGCSAAPFVFHTLCLQAELVSIGIKKQKDVF